MLDRGWKGTHQSLHHRLHLWDSYIRPTSQTTQANCRLPYPVRDLCRRPNFILLIYISQMVGNYKRGSRVNKHHPPRSPSPHPQAPLTSFSTHSHPPRALPRIGPKSPEAVPPTLPRHCANLPPPTGPAVKTRPRMAHEKMVRARDPDTRRGRARSRRRRACVLGSIEEKDPERARVWGVQDRF